MSIEFSLKPTSPTCTRHMHNAHGSYSRAIPRHYTIVASEPGLYKGHKGHKGAGVLPWSAMTSAYLARTRVGLRGRRRLDRLATVSARAELRNAQPTQSLVGSIVAVGEARIALASMLMLHTAVLDPSAKCNQEQKKARRLECRRAKGHGDQGYGLSSVLPASAVV